MEWYVCTQVNWSLPNVLVEWYVYVLAEWRQVTNQYESIHQPAHYFRQDYFRQDDFIPTIPKCSTTKIGDRSKCDIKKYKCCTCWCCYVLLCTYVMYLLIAMQLIICARLNEKLACKRSPQCWVMGPGIYTVHIDLAIDNCDNYVVTDWPGVLLLLSLSLVSMRFGPCVLARPISHCKYVFLSGFPFFFRTSRELDTDNVR